MEEPEEEGEPEIMKEDPEFEAPSAEDLGTPEGWCHHRAHLLKMGRCKKWEPPEAEEGEEEEPPAEEEEEEEEEEPIPMLNGLDSDESKIVTPLWKIANTGGQHGVISVQSMSWPGAVTVCKGKNFCNIYIGYGQKFLNGVFSPPPLPAVATEYTSGFNPEEAEEGEEDPMVEQMDLPPPKDADEGADGEGDDGEDEDE
jgi:radial spoke head protein 4A